MQPGVVQAQLQRAAAPHGLRFGPDPSTHDRCTIGGMIGNNACGVPRRCGYGRTSDNVLALDVLTGDGRARWRTCALRRPGAGAAGAGRRRPRSPRCAEVVAGGLATDPDRVRPVRPPGVGLRAASTCCRSAGSTCAGRWSAARARWRSCTEATVRAGRATRRTAAWWCSATPDIAAAADATPADAAAAARRACEGIDSRLVDVVRAGRGAAGCPTCRRRSGLAVRRGGRATPRRRR